VVDLTVRLEKAAGADAESAYAAIKAAMKQAAEKELKGILGYTEEPLVSSDYMQSSFSGTVDALETKVMGNLVKTLAWYDNEWGYSCRLRDIVKYIGE